jgi:hypothetical protein
LTEALGPIAKKYPQLDPEKGNAGKIAMRKAREVIRQYPNLSLCECAAIVMYTLEEGAHSVYVLMNEALHSMDRNAVGLWKGYIWLLLHALRKLPVANCTTVIRGCKERSTKLGLGIADGDVTSWRGFTSCTTDVAVMSGFLGTNGERTMVQIKLTEGNARDIRDFSLFPSEAEVILPPNVCLKKVGVFPAGHGLEILQLEQVRTMDPLLDMTTSSQGNQISKHLSPPNLMLKSQGNKQQHPMAGIWKPIRTNEWTHSAPGKHRERGNDPSSFLSFDHDGSGRWKMREWYGSQLLCGGSGPKWEGSYKSEHKLGDSGSFSVELLPDGTMRHRCDHWKELSYFKRQTPAPKAQLAPQADVQHPLTGRWKPCRHDEWFSKAPGKHRNRAKDSSSFLTYDSNGSGQWRIGDWHGTSIVCCGPGPRWEGTYKAEHTFGDSGRFSYELLSDGTLKVSVPYWKTVEYWRRDGTR